LNKKQEVDEQIEECDFCRSHALLIEGAGTQLSTKLIAVRGTEGFIERIASLVEVIIWVPFARSVLYSLSI
jgi:hypothetical protein